MGDEAAVEAFAIQIVDGKARLMAENLCDGLGACLGHCPQDAIIVERRESDAYDEAAVEVHLAEIKQASAATNSLEIANNQGHSHGGGGGCPSARLAQFAPSGGAEKSPCSGGAASAAPQKSELTHWPVMLNLLPPTAPVLQGAKLLIAADCVPAAYANFHADLLKDHVVVLGCPKFDDVEAYLEKVTQMIQLNDLAEVTVAHMEVPCCTGILMLAIEARRRANKDVPLYDIVIGTRGDLLQRREVPVG